MALTLARLTRMEKDLVLGGWELGAEAACSLVLPGLPRGQLSLPEAADPIFLGIFLLFCSLLRD